MKFMHSNKSSRIFSMAWLYCVDSEFMTQMFSISLCKSDFFRFTCSKEVLGLECINSQGVTAKYYKLFSISKILDMVLFN